MQTNPTDPGTADYERTKDAAAELVRTSLVWDNHVCLPLGPSLDRLLPELDRFHGAGVNIASINISYGGHTENTAGAVASAISQWVGEHREHLLLVRRLDDVDEAVRSERTGILFDIEGVEALEGDCAKVAFFYALGVRWMLPVYNKANAAGGGCLDTEDPGLSSFGREVVTEMNRVGMVVCASHCGHRTARDLIEFSESPAIFSHSNARAVWDHPRNIPDSLIRACASRGGVIGVNGFGPFLGPNDASIETFVHHVEHMLNVAGEDHVGIALDHVFDREELEAFIARNPTTFPPELYCHGAQMLSPERLVDAVRLLQVRGHSDGTLRKLLGGNHRRIAEQVWQ